MQKNSKYQVALYCCYDFFMILNFLKISKFLLNGLNI